VPPETDMTTDIDEKRFTGTHLAPASHTLESIPKSAAYRLRRHRIEKLRTAVQLAALAVVVWMGVEFVL